ncbi:MAG: hypothetical protein WCO45_01990 [Pseudanabaena sp. ELA607]|jgi:hypothetical protein
MQILSHRGYWQEASEKNTEIAFHRSFGLGFGTETDVRDALGELVISHDPPVGGEMKFSYFLEIYKEYDQALPLALNVKADGLQSRLKILLEQYQVNNYFMFDMSVPDAKLYVEQGFKVFTRQSELESVPSLYEPSIGVWLDCFYGDWLDNNVLESHINQHKQVCLVSPDLHKRSYKEFWQNLRAMSVVSSPETSHKVMICTDFPEEAKLFFADVLT